MHIISTGSRKARRSVFGNEEARINVDIGTIESLLPSDIARGVNLRTLYTLMPWILRVKGNEACECPWVMGQVVPHLAPEIC